jgi:hypothetical protein
MEGGLNQLNTPELLGERLLNLKINLTLPTTLIFCILLVINKLSPNTVKTYKMAYISSTTWRQTFLMTDNPLHRKKEKYIYDRSTTISSLYVGMRVHIYSGKRFYIKFVNR